MLALCLTFLCSPFVQAQPLVASELAPVARDPACLGAEAPRAEAAGSRLVAGGALPEREPEASSPDASPKDPFAAGALGLEFAGGVLIEAWNLNGPQELLFDGTAAIWWAWIDGFSLVGEFHATRVVQSPSRDAFVHSLIPLVRWRVLDRKAADWFVELGPGVSWSDTGVPPRGTRFNYLIQAGTGVTRRMTSQVHTVFTFRWFHLSNNGREGRGRNPDIEAFGGYVGVAIGL